MATGERYTDQVGLLSTFYTDQVGLLSTFERKRGRWISVLLDLRRAANFRFLRVK